MLRSLKPLRRIVAVLMAIIVIASPVTALAHVRAMAGHPAGCATMVPGHGMPASMPHAPAHQHPANCCDLCVSGCGVIALPATFDCAIEFWAPGHAQTLLASGEIIAGRADHLLPFSHAPPVFSV